MIKAEKSKTKTIFYRLQFTDSARFMAISLSNLVNNLAEGIHRNNSYANMGMLIKNVKHAELHTKIAVFFFFFFFVFTNFKENFKIKMFMLYQKLSTKV